MSINYEAYVADLVAKGHAAQKIAEGFDQAMVEKLTAAVAGGRIRHGRSQGQRIKDVRKSKGFLFPDEGQALRRFIFR